MTQPVPDAYLEVKVSVPRDLLDAACDFIIENITSGLVLEEEVDAPDTDIIFYVPDSDTSYKDQLGEFFKRQVPDLISETPEIRQRQVANTQWMEKYRESIEAIRLADDLLVRPTWIDATDDKYQLIIEPKMAFGTGSHATTRSCLRLIRQHLSEGERFLDMGCGSGILSILADKMGATYIKAIDYDLAAVDNCRENFLINGVKTPHDIATGSIEKCQSDEPYQFVCANIIRTTILSMIDALLKLVVPGGQLVLSGLLEQDEAPITEALKARHQDDFTIMRDEEWLTYLVSIR